MRTAAGARAIPTAAARSRRPSTATSSASASPSRTSMHRGAAHIHKGRAHQNGGIVVPLVHPQEGDPGASAGCMPVAEELAQAILEHPRRYYANVHTAAFGAGAVPGQLFRRSR